MRINVSPLIALVMVSACTKPPPTPAPLPEKPIGGSVGYLGIPPDLNPCTRVLAIDGGGIRGIVPTLILKDIEQHTRQPIWKSFDHIFGTSTGGLIALGLTKPDSADPSRVQFTAVELTELYEKSGETIFPSKFGVFRQLRSWVYGPKYSPSGLEEVLREYFGKATMNCALIPVTVTAYDLEHGRPFFFSRGDPETGDYLMRDVIRAATAAPTYFPPAVLPASPTYERKGYYALIDGGVFANDPEIYAELLSLPQLTQAGINEGPRPSLLLVSIGTGARPSTVKFQQAWNWGRITWIRELFDEILFTNPNDDLTVLGPNKLFQSMRGGLAGYAYVHIRLQPILTEAPLDDATEEEIGKLEAATKQYISKHRRELDKLEEVLRIPSGCRPIGGNRPALEDIAPPGENPACHS